jgi:Domain of unknown function (DUF4272)
MKTILLIILVLMSCSVIGANINERKDHIEKMENKVSKEAEDRKERSEKILKALNIPINPNLPYIEDSKEALIRNTEEVALRTIALLVVAVKAEGLEQEVVEKLVAEYQLANVFTPNEKKFIANPEPSQFDRTQFIWRYEAAWVLLWALGYVEELKPPTGICDVPASVAFLRERGRAQFIKDSKLRSIHELLDQNDLIYRYHWAVVDARVNGLKIPKEIDSSVVLERHYALN